MIKNCFFLLILAFSFCADADIKIGIISNGEYCGEREVAWRIKAAGERLGWQVLLDELEGRFLSEIEGLEWVINLLPYNKYPRPSCKNYQTIFHPFNFFDKRKLLKPTFENYDAFLMTIKPPKVMEKQFLSKGKNLSFIDFYPTVQKFEYKRVEINNLMTMIPVWGNRIKQEKFKKLYQALSNTKQVSFYGVDRNEDIIEHGYEGTIPFDGFSVIRKLQQHGIVLILHSDIHNSLGIPTSRIFEASAASVVIISDENSFVRHHYGDTVFYIDTTKSYEEIFAQIQNRLIYIFENQEEALDMALKAHQVFIDHFSMEDQLLELMNLHKRLISTKSK